MKKGFEIRTLGEVCEVFAGQSPPSSPYNFDGRGLPFFQGKADFGMLYPRTRVWCDAPTKIAQPNDILISVRAPVVPTNLCSTEASIGRGLSAIRAKNGTDVMYVLYYLRAIEPQLSTQGRGLTFSAITQSEIRNLNIPLPPLPIQKQIAAILEKADAAREKRRQANQLTEQFLQSAFLEMFGESVTNPKGWKKTSIGDISSHVSSGSTPLGGESTYLPTGMPFIRSQNVQMNRLDLSDVAHISQEVHNGMKRTWVKNGDVLLNITGASIGRVAFFKGLDDSANVNQHVCIIRPMKSRATPAYISFFISMPSYQSVILSRNSGATRQAFNFEQVRAFQIHLPPLPEQQKFAPLVEKVEELRGKQRESERELENLFQSLMQRAFRGELVQ